MTDVPESPGFVGAGQRVYLGIMRELEQRTLVPGQRLVESELALRYNVGRNAVREAMQSLAARGVVDLAPHRSPAIRKLDLAESCEILDVAAALTNLAARTAAKKFDAAAHGRILAQAMQALDEGANADDPGIFSAARRRFYRVLLAIGGNRELQRVYPAVGMHVIYSQYRSARMQHLRLEDYRRLCAAIMAGNADEAAQAGSDHVERVRGVIIETLSPLSQGTAGKVEGP